MSVLALKQEFLDTNGMQRRILIVRVRLANGRYFFSVRSQRRLLDAMWVCEYSSSHTDIESSITSFLIALMHHKDGNGYSHSVYKENRLNGAMSA